MCRERYCTIYNTLSVIWWDMPRAAREHHYLWLTRSFCNIVLQRQMNLVNVKMSQVWRKKHESLIVRAIFVSDLCYHYHFIVFFFQFFVFFFLLLYLFRLNSFSCKYNEYKKYPYIGNIFHKILFLKSKR